MCNWAASSAVFSGPCVGMESRVSSGLLYFFSIFLAASGEDGAGTRQVLHACEYLVLGLEQRRRQRMALLGRSVKNLALAIKNSPGVIIQARYHS